MDYTNSNSFATDAGTAQRMHLQGQAVPTAVSDSDLNGLTWEALAVIKAAGIVPAAFDKAVPGTYTQLSDAVAIAVRTQSAAIAGAGGTADALTGIYGPVVSALVNGLTLNLRAVFANATTTPTFTTNGLVAKTIVKGNGLPLVAGDIAGAGHWIELRYDWALDKWVLLNPANGVTQAQQPGEVCYFARNTAPTGFLKANGALISRVAYASLFSAIGTTFGVGDGATTFTLPDLRSEFIRGWDDARGVDTGRVFGSAQAGDIAPHSHSVLTTIAATSGTTFTAINRSDVSVGGSASNTQVTNTNTGTETRPRNVALLACIKY